MILCITCILSTECLGCICLYRYVDGVDLNCGCPQRYTGVVLVIYKKNPVLFAMSVHVRVLKFLDYFDMYMREFFLQSE